MDISETCAGPEVVVVLCYWDGASDGCDDGVSDDSVVSAILPMFLVSDEDGICSQDALSYEVL